jgi:pimeloyl-ACP methyl ester carboxylesterase
VSPSIGEREVVGVTVDGNCLWGTYHRSRDRSSDPGSSSLPASGEKNRIGILFLNAGFLPRGAPSTVYWAESFAKAGYPAFRFDLPGLGDSAGNVPDDMLEFVSAGGYTHVLSTVVKEVVERFSLSGIVLMGLCAGAVSALFTIAITPECRGVVLMDPFFNIPQERAKIRAELSEWVNFSRVGAIASKIFHQVRHLALLLRRNKLPGNANRPLLRCWKQVTSARTPILLLKAPAAGTRGVKPKKGVFDYIGYLQASSGRASQVAIHFIEGAQHTFADEMGCSAVRRHTLEWLQKHFPLEAEAVQAVPRKRAAAASGAGAQGLAVQRFGSK